MAVPISWVPLEKLSSSKTPTGPFHKIVFEDIIIFLNFSNDLGHESKPSYSSEIESIANIFDSAPSLNSFAQTTSTGK